MSINSIRKQKRDNRLNINLTDDEAEMFNLISKMTGESKGVILRNIAVKHALTILTADNTQEFSLEKLLNKGTSEHLQGS